MGTFTVNMSDPNVDPNLLSWMQAAAANMPYNVVVYSGRREGDPRFHGKGMAVDVNLIDPATGKTIPNYQNAAGFSAYQSFANAVRGAQMATNPEMAQKLRWGGYFSGPKGKYGSMDLMHFDVGGDTVPMGGGSWEGGLTPEQAALWGLSPGGGYSGAGTVATAFQQPAAIPAGRDPFRDIDLSGLASNAAKRLKPSQESGMTGGGEATPMPIQPIETVAAAPETLAAPWTQAAPGLREMAPLADLFKVQDIGAQPLPATAPAPYAPPRRGF